MQGIDVFVPGGDKKAFADDKVDFLLRPLLVCASQGRKVEYEVNKILVFVHLGLLRGVHELLPDKRVEAKLVHKLTHLALGWRHQINPCQIALLVPREHI